MRDCGGVGGAVAFARVVTGFPGVGPAVVRTAVVGAEDVSAAVVGTAVMGIVVMGIVVAGNVVVGSVIGCCPSAGSAGAEATAAAAFGIPVRTERISSLEPI